MDLSNENIVHIKNGDVEYLQFRKLLEYKDKLTHAYTLKPLRFSSRNTEETLKKNYTKICKSLDIPVNSLLKAHQTHTKNIEIVKNIPETLNFTKDNYEEVDGFITDKKEIALITRYADCTPIILYDKSKNVVSNVHSGWKGTLQKISQIAVQKMVKEYNSNPKDIIVCIGPHIRKCHFEVEGDFIKTFESEFGNIEKYYKKAGIVEEKQKYYFNSISLIKDYLIEIGISENNIFDSGLCSVCNKEKMHSFRSEKENADRNIAIAYLR